MGKEYTLAELYRLKEQIEDDIWRKEIANDFYYTSYEYREDSIELAEIKQKIREMEGKK
jgi:hypothetical protein